jgi:hypothetical protein
VGICQMKSRTLMVLSAMCRFLAVSSPFGIVGTTGRASPPRRRSADVGVDRTADGLHHAEAQQDGPRVEVPVPDPERTLEEFRPLLLVRVLVPASSSRMHPAGPLLPRRLATSGRLDLAVALLRSARRRRRPVREWLESKKCRQSLASLLTGILNLLHARRCPATSVSTPPPERSIGREPRQPLPNGLPQRRREASLPPSSCAPPASAPSSPTPMPRGHHCRMDLPGPTTSVGTRTDYSVGPWVYPTCAAPHLMA